MRASNEDHAERLRKNSIPSRGRTRRGSSPTDFDLLTRPWKGALPPNHGSGFFSATSLRRLQDQKIDGFNHRRRRFFAGRALQSGLATFKFGIAKKRQGRVGAEPRAFG